MTDFRNLHLSEPTTKYENTRSVIMNFKYRNPITSLFFNVTGMYEWNTCPYMLNQLFIDDCIVGSYSPMKYDGKNLSVNGSISKGLMSGRVTIGLDATFAQVETSTMRQDVVSPYAVSVFSVQPNFKGYLTSWLSTDYRLVYTRNMMDIESTEISNYDALKQFLTLTFVPAKEWQIAIGGEHYYTKFSSGSSESLILLDTSFRWNVSKKADISLTAANLLNRREYLYANYGLLSETEYMYRLRGRSIMASIQVRL